MFIAQVKQYILAIAPALQINGPLPAYDLAKVTSEENPEVEALS